jgi:ABC-2 type transport system permease protein
MKALLIARKNLLEILREPKLLLLVVLVPLAFLGITAAGYSYPMLVTHPLLVIDSTSGGTGLVEELETQRYADGRPVFEVTPTTDRAAAETALKEQTATALVTISTNDSKGQTQGGQAQEGQAQGLPLQITVRGDPLYLHFYRASIILDNIFYRYADDVAGRPEIVRTVEQPLVETGPQTMFDLYAPGMIIFALLLIIPQTAMLVAHEIRWNTLRRLRLTPMRAFDLLSGVGLAQIVVAVVMVVLIFFVALAFGFNNQGSLGLAIIVGLAVSFSAIGLGLLVACFVENDSQAINVGSTVTMIQVFLSGSFYQLPPQTVFTLAGYQIDLFDIFPATHGFLALQQVLSYGAGLKEIGFRLGATLVLSILYFVIGVITFQRLQMRDYK